jgi:Ca2+-transporting ATPase
MAEVDILGMTTTKTEEISGLTEKEARERFEKFGYNELPSQKKRSIFLIFWNVIKEPMLLLLLISGGIYYFISPKDAAILFTFVVVVIGITFYQEKKTERALEALKNLSSPRALVIRDGVQKRIAGREVVPGDIVVLNEGDRVPADGVVLNCSNLLADESLLTGESSPVRKMEYNGDDRKPKPGGDDLAYVFSGSLLIHGRGMIRVMSTGDATEIGKIGKALESTQEEEPILKRETTRIVRNFAIAGLFLCLIVIVAYGTMHDDWLRGFLAGLTLAMAVLPEEFSVVLVIFLTLGAWRISKKNVLTRRTAAIETLGSATVLCVDKTGTITMNRMKLKEIFSHNSFLKVDSREHGQLPEKFHGLLEYSMLASQRDPFDPIEKEINEAGKIFLSGTEHIHENWELVKEYPLSRRLLALSHVWRSPDDKNYVIAAKGAPEAIFDLCHFDEKQKEELLINVRKMASQGLRIIGVAKSYFQKEALPDEQHDFLFDFTGLLGFEDPVRPGVKDAVEECHEAGIRVIMITGDYPETAKNIAREIGLDLPEKYISGAELENMNTIELREKIKDTSIFARVVPEQKLLIIDALKSNGEVVAMTGDGVNDAPALKSAHIGIAMGERGTDVAREASALVLLNDDFSSIVSAVRLGRRIFDNLRKAMAYIFAIHIPIAGMSLFPVLFNLPVVLLPAHIAFLELIIDPSCSVVFEAEPEEEGIMKRKPRNLKDPLFNKRALYLSFLQGLSVLFIVFAVFLYTLVVGRNEGDARTITFTALVVANLMLILINLSWSRSLLRTIKTPNSSMWWVIGGAFVSLIAVLYVPFLRNLFHFSVLHFNDLAMAVIAGMSSVVWFEALKLLNGRKKRSNL